MHIGFDISQTGKGKAGCGYFSHAMLQAMQDTVPYHRYSLYPSFGSFYFDALMPLQNPYKYGHYGPRHLCREKASFFWENGNIEKLLGKPDIIHSNNFWCPTKIRSTRLIYTFYDMGFMVNPTWTTETNRAGCFEGVFRSSIHADWVIAISEASKNHYLSLFPHFPPERIRVIYPCSRFVSINQQGKCPKALENVSPNGFWLNVGTIEPRKNQRRLMEAYARYISCGGSPMPLVLAGGEGWLMDDFKNYLVELNIIEHVIFTGYVSDAELMWLYQNCYANLYASLFEGFGLPVLEGMQFGAPTLCSNVSSLPEVAGDAAILLDPYNVDVWADAMFNLSKNPEMRNQLKGASQKQASLFSWKESASSLLKLYAEAMLLPKRLPCMVEMECVE